MPQPAQQAAILKSTTPDVDSLRHSQEVRPITLAIVLYHPPHARNSPYQTLPACMEYNWL